MPCHHPSRSDKIHLMDNREKLIELVRKRSFLTSDEPIFRLASGKMSKVYFDLRLTTLSPEGLEPARFTRTAFEPGRTSGVSSGLR